MFNLAVALLLNLPTTPITVMVIDTGVQTLQDERLYSCSHKLNFNAIHPSSSHGQAISRLIKERTLGKNVCQIIARGVGDKEELPMRAYINALRWAAMLKPDIVNLSLSGYYNVDEERMLIKSLLDGGTVVVAAAGNESQTIDSTSDIYPANSDPRVIVASSPAPFTNHGPRVNVMVPESKYYFYKAHVNASSKATAETSAMIANILVSRGRL